MRILLLMAFLLTASAATAQRARLPRYTDKGLNLMGFVWEHEPQRDTVVAWYPSGYHVPEGSGLPQRRGIAATGKHVDGALRQLAIRMYDPRAGLLLELRLRLPAVAAERGDIEHRRVFYLQHSPNAVGCSGSLSWVDAETGTVSRTIPLLEPKATGAIDLRFLYQDKHIASGWFELEYEDEAGLHRLADGRFDVTYTLK